MLCVLVAFECDQALASFAEETTSVVIEVWQSVG